MKKICLLLLFASPLFLSAQALTGQDIKDQMIKDWTRARAYTLEYLNTMPADKYSFKAVDSIRSYAQQMLHMSMGTVFLTMLGTGNKNTPPGFDRSLESRPGAQTHDSVVHYVLASYDFAIQSIQSFDPVKFGEQVDRGKEKISRYSMLLKGFEHQTHHRGQTTIYIRLLGIRPPAEQL